MKKIATLFVVFAMVSIISAQYYSTGSDPARLKWRQIKTQYVRLVFEKNFEVQALQLAATIDSVAPLVQVTMQHRPVRIDLLVHNQMSYSNGLLSWAPSRMEFFAIPHQNILSTDWLKELAIHEYRHAAQALALNGGITRVASFITGQHATGIVLGYSLPMWFLEGDAVAAETLLTPSGRGRSFEFNQELKAQLVERGVFSFDKAYMGSYREKVPNYYRMGYPLVAMARCEYGARLWEAAVSETGRRNPLSQMNRPLRRATGLRSRQLYESMFTRLANIWRQEAESETHTAFRTIVPSGNDYQSYEYLTAINDSISVCELTGPAVRSQIVEVNIRDGSVKTLVYTGLREESPVSANSQMVVWAELQYHLRWDNESFSVIRIYNRTTGTAKTLTRHTRLFSPAIHPYRPLIAAVEATTDYRFFITFVDALSGETLKRVAAPDNRFILTPKWNLEGDNLIAVLLDDDGKALYTLDMETEKWNRVSDFTFDEKCYPVQRGNDVWYAANGLLGREIFHLDLPSGKKTRLTASRFGASFPTIAPGSTQLLYASYTDTGYKPVLYVSSQVNSDMPVEGSSFIHRLAADLAKQEPPAGCDTIPEREYRVEPYSKFNLLNFHSWAPLYVDVNNAKVAPGFSLMSQNLLGTSIMTAGFNIDPSMRNEKFVVDYSYYGFFPVIGLRFTCGDEDLNGMFRTQNELFRLSTGSKVKIYHIAPGIGVPLNFSSGSWQQRLNLQTNLRLEHQTGYTLVKELYTAQGVPTGIRQTATVAPFNYCGINYSLQFYNVRRGTLRDVGTRMGQSIQLIYGHTPWGNFNAGSIAAIYTRLFFPGLLKHHSIAVDNVYQFTSSGQQADAAGIYNTYRRFGNAIGYPRGCTTLYGDHIYMLKTNYMLPLLNPDFSLGRFAYIKRIRLNVFCDYATTSYALVHTQTDTKTHFTNRFASLGGELNVDLHLMRFTLPFSIGCRTGYASDGSGMFYEALMSTSFGNFLVD